MDVKSCGKYKYGEFYINMNKSGMIKVSNTGRSSKNVLTNSKSAVLMFTADGRVFSIPAYMLQDMGNEGIHITKLMGKIDVKDVLALISIENFDSGYMYFFTGGGIVKKTPAAEFKDINLWDRAYKFKNREDFLIDVKYSRAKNPQVLLVNNSGMAIKFRGTP